ncbi:MAG: hypothetical protein V1867_05420 [Candidatus Falkowbacteria bacterium]
MKENKRKFKNPVLYGAGILAVAVLAGTVAWTGYQASAQDNVTTDNENTATENNEKYNQIRQDLAAIAEKYKPRLDQNGNISRDDWAGMQGEIYDTMKKQGINPGVMIQNAKATVDKGEDKTAGGNDQDGQFRDDLAAIAEKYKPRLDQNGNISRSDWVRMQEEIYDLMKRSNMNPGVMIQDIGWMDKKVMDKSDAPATERESDDPWAEY